MYVQQFTADGNYIRRFDHTRGKLQSICCLLSKTAQINYVSFVTEFADGFAFARHQWIGHVSDCVFIFFLCFVRTMSLLVVVIWPTLCSTNSCLERHFGHLICSMEKILACTRQHRRSIYMYIYIWNQIYIYIYLYSCECVHEWVDGWVDGWLEGCRGASKRNELESITMHGNNK